MRIDKLRISEDKASRLTAFITGCTVALGTTTLFFSLTSDVRSGYELAFADFLLPVALFTGYRFRLLVLPSASAILLATVVLLSSVSLIATFSAVYFAAIILSLSALRVPIARHKKEFYVPLLIVVGLSVVVALGWQSLVHHHHRLWGLHGAANPAGGVAAFLAILIAGPLAVIPLLMLGLTASRGGMLGLVLGSLALGRKHARWILFLLVGELLILLAITGVASILGQENTLGEPNENSLYLPATQPLSRFTPTEIIDELRNGLRADQAKISLETTRLLPSGFGAGTRYEATNPHNIYLIFWNNLGWGLGSLAIASLLALLVRSRDPLLACILAAGIFDHVWITAPIGIYLLATSMAFASTRIESRTALQLDRGLNMRKRVWQFA